mmetsp:Transcript_10169/g.17916  ORF Transcript_10169/g.17916 Transcript_10169/m.17916 type:complete len:1166 (+) Transcript_10169:263-3760(+)
MGVPAFFRYLSEKYPKIATVALEQQGSNVDASAPNPNGYEFDNLYLDMNGLIHPCTHPEGEEPPSTEEEMYLVIFRYLDRLLNLVRPRKLVYMAIDGVAPRAKMNQQRSRRFRSAQEAAEAEEDADRIRKEMKERGLRAPPKAPPVWDSNVITPGTEFMNTLSDWLRYYISERLNKNPAFKNVRVILSDAQSPGEGEHKLMQFIRRQRAEPGYDPNTSHCMYGLDADLIMLGLASHEIHFTILREEVLFGKAKKQKEREKQGFKVDPVLLDNGGVKIEDDVLAKMGMLGQPKKPFVLVRLWVLREYLAYEFRPETFYQPLTFEYNLESCLDDFVFICFFVGNDFLPHLPSLSIHEGGLDLLLDIYRRVLPTIRGYLTTDGKVNLERVDVFMGMLGMVEDEIFARRRRRELNDKRRKAQQANTRRLGGHQRALAQTQLQQADSLQRVPRRNQRQDHAPPPPTEVFALGRGREGQGPIKAAPAPDADANKSAASNIREKLKSAKRKHSTEDASVSKEDAAAATIAPMLKRTRLTKRDNNSSGEEGDKAEESSNTVEEKPAEEEFKLMLKEKEHERNFDDSVVDEVRLGEDGWKERYYISKYGPEYGDPKSKERRKIVEEYVTGLCWVMEYYYKGVQSWTWYYPYHYAPMASDLVNVDEFNIEFPPSKPFKPVEQLMGVFPSSSAHALPEPCRWYMTDVNSPIADFYPLQFDYDPNGKGVRWLWIALLPFIDEKRLTDVTRKIEDELSEKDKARNELHPDLVFAHQAAVGTEAMINAAEQHGEAKVSIEEEVALNSAPKDGEQEPESKNNTEEESDVIESSAPTTSGDVRGLGGRILSSKETNGIAGYFCKPPAKFEQPLGETRPAPSKRVSPIPNNQVAVFDFRLPKLRKHFCRLLEGVKMPPVTLSIQELMLVRVPQMGPRGSSVANLLIEKLGGNPAAMGSQRSGMNPHQYNRSLSQNVQTAGLLQAQNQRNQYTWGSMEPRPRFHHGGRNHHNQHQHQHQQQYGDRGNQGYHSQQYHHQRRDNQGYNSRQGHGGYDNQRHAPQYQQQYGSGPPQHRNQHQSQQYGQQQQHRQHHGQQHHGGGGNNYHRGGGGSSSGSRFQHLNQRGAPRGPPPRPQTQNAFSAIQARGPQAQGQAPQRAALMNSLASTLMKRKNGPGGPQPPST